MAVFGSADSSGSAIAPTDRLADRCARAAQLLIMGTLTGDSSFTVATFNVNGIRAARRRGFDRWLAARSPDVVALQELRCPASEVNRPGSDRDLVQATSATEATLSR
ncbi:exodeoxyribonuclease III (xth) [Gordonia bronchialis]|nr:exodeoxyribonuclease III (xth) [Gordonia bronchialis]